MSEFFITGVGPYRTRDGRRAWVADYRERSQYPYDGYVDERKVTWDHSGFCFFDGHEDPHDIVAKWTDPEPPKPVQTDHTIFKDCIVANEPGTVIRGVQIVQDNDGHVQTTPKSSKRKSVLDAAAAAVADRGLNYGSPEDNFERIARHWTTHLINTGIMDIGVLHNGTGLEASDVAIMLALVKIARLENDPAHADSWVDIAGYAACGAEVSDAKLL